MHSPRGMPAALPPARQPCLQTGVPPLTDAADHSPCDGSVGQGVGVVDFAVARRGSPVSRRPVGKRRAPRQRRAGGGGEEHQCQCEAERGNLCHRAIADGIEGQGARQAWAEREERGGESGRAGAGQGKDGAAQSQQALLYSLGRLLGQLLTEGESRDTASEGSQPAAAWSYRATATHSAGPSMPAPYAVMKDRPELPVGTSGLLRMQQPSHGLLQSQWLVGRHCGKHTDMMLATA